MKPKPRKTPSRKHKKTLTPKAAAGTRRGRSASVWDETLRVVSSATARRRSPSAPTPAGEFTPGELGAPDPDEVPDERNPAGVQGGRGPLNQEGEGNRQNDELAELEESAELDEDKGRRER